MLAVVALIVAYNAVANLVLPEPAYVPANMAFAGLLVFIAMASGSTISDLGLRPDRVGRGLRVGLAAAGLVAVVLLVFALIPAARDFFEDERAAVSGVPRALYEALIRIPLGTAVPEEVVFRGVLFGMLLRRTSALGAAVVASALFGLWHVIPALDVVDANAALDRAASFGGTPATVIGAVVATTLGGFLFVWLRLRANSLLASVLAHAAVNSLTFVAAYVILQTS